MRAPPDRHPDRFNEKSVFELLPKGKLLAAVSLLALLIVVIYLQRHSQRAMQGLQGLVGPAPAPGASDASGAPPVRRVQIAPAPAAGGSTP